MNATFERGERDFVKIWIGCDCPDFQEEGWAYFRALDEGEFIDLLCNRMEKGVSEIHDILESYRSLHGGFVPVNGA